MPDLKKRKSVAEMTEHEKDDEAMRILMDHLAASSGDKANMSRAIGQANEGRIDEARGILEGGSHAYAGRYAENPVRGDREGNSMQVLMAVLENLKRQQRPTGPRPQLRPGQAL